MSQSTETSYYEYSISKYIILQTKKNLKSCDKKFPGLERESNSGSKISLEDIFAPSNLFIGNIFAKMI